MTTMRTKPVRFPKRKTYVPPFENGDHMDQKTFHALYEKTPAGFKAELIGGVVYMASPVRAFQGEPHLFLSHWLSTYRLATPGTAGTTDTSHYLSDISEVQPDLSLRLLPEAGGKCMMDAEGYLLGPPELALEISLSSLNNDLHAKKLDYERYGVREYLVIDVAEEKIHWFARAKGGFVPLEPAEDSLIKSRIFPGLWLDPSAAFDLESTELFEGLQRGLASAEHAVFVAKLWSKLTKKGRK